MNINNDIDSLSIFNYVFLQLKKELESADEEDDVVFQSLVSRSKEILGLSEKDFARRFGASLPTVRRWINGDNAPHPRMRAPVYKFLIDKLTEKLGTI